MKKWIILLIVGYCMLPPSVYALDYRMSEITWTFDTISNVKSANEVQNLGGIYYQGNIGSDIVDLGKETKGEFSDGSSWNSKPFPDLIKPAWKSSLTQRSDRSKIRTMYRKWKIAASKASSNTALPFPERTLE